MPHNPYSKLVEALRAVVRQEVAAAIQAEARLQKRLEQNRQFAPPVRTPKQSCAVVDCAGPASSRGYCRAHYQKFRTLRAQGVAAALGWLDNAPPNTVHNVIRPRGRAAKTIPPHAAPPAPPNPPPEMLTVEAVAALLGRTSKAIHNRVARGTMPGVVRVGRSVYIRRDALLSPATPL